jgi:hypothetical protein
MARFEIHFLDDRSDESLLNEVRRVAAGYSGSNLTLSEFAKLSSKVSGQTLRKRFGTWGNALERAAWRTCMLPQGATRKQPLRLKVIRSWTNPARSGSSGVKRIAGKYALRPT